MNKNRLVKKKNSDEKMLFHGIKGDIVKEINEKGLYRSYAGKANGNVL